MIICKGLSHILHTNSLHPGYACSVFVCVCVHLCLEWAVKSGVRHSDLDLDLLTQELVTQ
jgi:hypothetical protein